jgi:hypothetical protein
LFYFIHLRVLFGFCLKAKAWQRMVGKVVPTHVEAPPLVSAASAEKQKRGAKALWKTGARRAPRSTRAIGHGRKPVKAVAISTLLDVETGASDELSLMIRQSLKDSRYTPLAGMEEVE